MIFKSVEYNNNVIFLYIEFYNSFKYYNSMNNKKIIQMSIFEILKLQNLKN